MTKQGDKAFETLKTFDSRVEDARVLYNSKMCLCVHKFREFSSTRDILLFLPKVAKDKIRFGELF